MTTVIVRLNLLGEARDLEVIEREPVLARYSGKPRRRIDFTLRVRDEAEHESLEAELNRTVDGPAVITSPDGIKWEVTSHSYDYRNGMSAAHQIELTEREELNIDRIEFGGFALTPDRWSFEINDNPTLAIMVSMASEQHQQFEEFLTQKRMGTAGDSYFPVSLIGVKEQPISMRFGRCLWQDLGEGSARHMIVLVSEEGDDQGQGMAGLLQLSEPAMDRLVERAIVSKLKFDALIEELRRAGVLSGDAIERINSAADDIPLSAFREFERAINVDEFFT